MSSSNSSPDLVPQQRITPRCLKGFRDYLPDVMAERARIIELIRKGARLGGFQAVATPALEYAETLLGQGGDETDKQVYRFTDHGDRQVALRFDLTVPFARFVAEHMNELSFPFKRLQIGEVWRGEKPQKGRYREFVQCDLDIIGADSAAADIEILSIFYQILASLPLPGSASLPFTIAVGDRVVLSALIHKFLPSVGKAAESAVLVAIDKLAKIGLEKVINLIAVIPGADADAARSLITLLTTRNAAGHADLEKVATALAGDDAALAEIARLRLVMEALGSLTQELPAGRIVVDLTIARGLGYYTGIVFETTLDDLPGFGSVASGGRYNNLASRFAARELPGVGGSVGLDRLVAGLEELGRVAKSTGATVFVAVAEDAALAYGLSLVRRLRQAGIATDVAMHGRLGQQFKHADRLGCSLSITVGGDEVKAQSYALKDMRKHTEERNLPLSGLLDKVKTTLAAL